MNDSKNMRSSTWEIAIPAAIAWFGFHCGSGFATGRQVVQYTTRHGWAGAWMPIAIWTILAIVYYNAIEFSRLTRSSNYKDFVMEFYNPIGKIILIVFDVSVLAGAFIGIAGILAGAGELINSSLGLGYWPGVLIFTVIVLLSVTKGYNVIAKVASAVTVPLIVSLIIVIIAGIANNFDNLRLVMSNSAMVEGDSLKSMFSDVLTYTGTQSAYLAAFIGISATFTSHKDTKIAVGVGSLLNFVMHFSAVLLLFSYYPAINNEPLAILEIVKQTPWGFLVHLYQIVLFLAFVSTSVTMVFGAVSRYHIYGEKFIPDVNKRKNAWIVFILIGSIFISGFGLVAIISTGYKVVASMRVPIITLPILLLGQYRLYQRRAKIKEDSN